MALLGLKTNLFSRLETSAPVVNLDGVPDLIGANSKEIVIEIKDEQSGIYSAKVIVEYNNQQKVAYEKRIDGVKKNLNLKLDIATVVRQFKKSVSSFDDEQGEVQNKKVKTIVEVRNHSFWHKKTRETRSSDLDLQRPSLSVLSLQHAANKGGAEFVVLQADDSNLSQVGVRIDGTIFRAVKLSEFDDEFIERPNIYGVLFALPIEMKSSIMAFAFDTAGNITQRKLSFNVRNFRRSDSKINISDNFVNNKVMPLYEEFAHQDVDVDNSVQVFKKVNQDYRQELQKRLAGLSLKNKAISRERFVKPMAASTTSNFGESRRYFLNGDEAGGSTHDGLDLASVKRDKVLASNSGTVVLAEPFGIYGKAVVIDHGMGLISLYGHLSQLEVTVGQEVQNAELIGRSGETGLAGGDHLHFEYRIANIPVNPREWLDPKWIRDHIFGKIKAIKKDLAS